MPFISSAERWKTRPAFATLSNMNFESCNDSPTAFAATANRVYEFDTTPISIPSLSESPSIYRHSSLRAAWLSPTTVEILTRACWRILYAFTAPDAWLRAPCTPTYAVASPRTSPRIRCSIDNMVRPSSRKREKAFEPSRVAPALFRNACVKEFIELVVLRLVDISACSALFKLRVSMPAARKADCVVRAAVPVSRNDRAAAASLCCAACIRTDNSPVSVVAVRICCAKPCTAPIAVRYSARAARIAATC